ncbi:MAG: hypothetical protein RLZZ245_3537 [Verrucomicrobiota bacterium]|jgi:hypothetical protein
MPRHVSIQPGQLYPQPDYSISVDREGKWTATQIFLCHRNSITKLMPRPGTPHPEIPFIAVDNSTAQVSEGDIAEITCNYAGTDNNDNDANKTTYSLGLSLSEEPLLSHEKFHDLDEEELEALLAIISGKEKDASGNPYKDKVTSSSGKKALEKIQRGQTSYYSPKVIWRQATVRKASAASADMRKIGKIDEPDGRQPSLSDDRNWLYNGATQTQEGNSYRIEREWIASDRGGWDPDIYDD